jgi:hypothetical protein
VEKLRMGLVGCYSNPEIQSRLRQLGLVPKAIERVLSEATGPCAPATSMPRSKTCSVERYRHPRSRTGWPSGFTHQQSQVVRVGRGWYWLA